MDRVVNFFPEERRNQLLMDLSSNLRAVVSQRLIPTIDGKGRRAAVEVLINTPLVSERLLNGEFKELKDIMARSRELGMRTFDWALFDLYDAGQISYENALHNADSANELRLNIKLKSKRGEPTEASGIVLEMHEEEALTPAELAERRRAEMLRQDEKRKQLERERLEREYQASKLAQLKRRQKEDDELSRLQADKSLRLDDVLVSPAKETILKIVG